MLHPSLYRLKQIPLHHVNALVRNTTWGTGLLSAPSLQHRVHVIRNPPRTDVLPFLCYVGYALYTHRTSNDSTNDTSWCVYKCKKGALRTLRDLMLPYPGVKGVPRKDIRTCTAMHTRWNTPSWLANIFPYITRVLL